MVQITRINNWRNLQFGSDLSTFGINPLGFQLITLK